MTRTTHRAIAAAVVVFAALASGCDSTNPPDDAPPGATTAASTSATTAPQSAAPQTRDQASQAAINAYVNMQNAFLKASQLGDPAYPQLPKYTTGLALTRLTDGLKSYQSKGLLGRGQAVYHPTIESLAPADAPSKARVRDCMDTSDTELYKANGEPYQDTPGGLRLVLADVERVDGVWKVTGFGVHEVGSCTV